MSTDKKTVDWYNKQAPEYADHVRDPIKSKYHAYYEKPAMYQLLPDLKGKNVISLGCGTGEDSNYLKQAGAVRSVGIDISSGQIAMAKQSYSDCEFAVMDMEKLDFEDESFDFAYSSLALSYLYDWAKVLGEVYRILRPGSRFLFSCEHPVNTAMKFTKESMTLGVVKDKANNQSIVTGDYLNKHKSPAGISPEVTTWHRPLSEMSADIAQSGFVIKQIVEPKPLPEMEEISRRTYQSLLKVPEFIVFQLEKTAA